MTLFNFFPFIYLRFFEVIFLRKNYSFLAIFPRILLIDSGVKPKYAAT